MKQFLLVNSVVAVLAGGATVVALQDQDESRPTTAQRLTPGDVRGQISHGGLQREYLVHVPPGYDGVTAMPVVFLFHGGTGSAAHAARSYGWNEKADAENFIVVYPEGTGRLQTWNAMHCCGEALRKNVDDVGFVRAMLTDLRTIASIDDARIYATGMSNGAMFCHRLGAEMSDVLAAIAPVAGGMGGRTNDRSEERRPAKPEHPVPIIMVHGLNDHNAPFAGGHPTAGFTNERSDISIPDAVLFWIEANGCNTEPGQIAFDPALAGIVEGEQYTNATTGRADVVLYRILQGGHAWPGGVPPRREGADEPITQWSATDAIWEFFAAHPKSLDLVEEQPSGG